MNAPKGNQFWKLRSKHGRDTLFASPELLWQAAEEYFQWCVDNPLMEIDYKGKDATMVKIPKMRAFTIQGLCLYLDCNVKYFRDFQERIAKGETPERGFSPVITRIMETIYNQKFIGAASGFLDRLIIARDIGLVEKRDFTSNGQTFQPPTIVIDKPDEEEDDLL